MLKLISASVNSLNLKPNGSAVQFNKIIQARDPAHQITPKFETTITAIKLINTHAKRVHKHVSYLSPAPRNHIANVSGNFNNLKKSYSRRSYQLTLQLPSKMQLIVNNPSKIGINYLSQRNHFTNFKCSLIRRHSTDIS